jgi:tRNA(adenine34) deaminase
METPKQKIQLTGEQAPMLISPFEQSVFRQVERLKTSSLPAVAAEVASKRAAWFAEKYPHGFSGAKTPRRAFEMLFFEYMGLAPEDLPVVSESEEEIVWLSVNPCPTLEACQRLGLDTRSVCRDAYERSTQALVGLIDPDLRFGRSYEEIRPYAGYCKEWIRRE